MQYTQKAVWYITTIETIASFYENSVQGTPRDQPKSVKVSYNLNWMLVLTTDLI